MSKPLEKITCTFNIFDSGREYSGIKRGYVLDNIKKAINSPFTQERIKLREAVGYVGHGLREMAGKLNLGEVDSINLGNGQRAMVKALPACVTTGLEVDENGNITHTQEILDNDEGRALLGLHRSKVGGFSWAAGGARAGLNTLIDKIYGFDYVVNPNFAANRGYVLDSADSEEITEQAVLDSMIAAGVDQSQAGDRLSSWYASAVMESASHQHRAADLEAQVTDLMLKNRELEKQLSDAQQIITDSANDTAGRREQLLREFAREYPVHINADKLAALATATTSDDLDGLRQVLDSVSRVNTSGLPMAGRGELFVPDTIWAKERAYMRRRKGETPAYGSIESAPDLGLY